MGYTAQWFSMSQVPAFPAQPSLPQIFLFTLNNHAMGKKKISSPIPTLGKIPEEQFGSLMRINDTAVITLSSSVPIHFRNSGEIKLYSAQ